MNSETKKPNQNLNSRAKAKGSAMPKRTAIRAKRKPGGKLCHEVREEAIRFVGKQLLVNKAVAHIGAVLDIHIQGCIDSGIFTHKQAHAAIGVSQGTIRGWMELARARTKKKLTDDMSERSARHIEILDEVVAGNLEEYRRIKSGEHTTAIVQRVTKGKDLAREIESDDPKGVVTTTNVTKIRKGDSLATLTSAIERPLNHIAKLLGLHKPAQVNVNIGSDMVPVWASMLKNLAIEMNDPTIIERGAKVIERLGALNGGQPPQIEDVRRVIEAENNSDDGDN